MDGPFTMAGGLGLSRSIRAPRPLRGQRQGALSKIGCPADFVEPRLAGRSRRSTSCSAPATQARLRASPRAACGAPYR